MKISMMAVLVMMLGLLVMHDAAESRHAKLEAASRAGVERRLEQLQTDVSDLRQSVDALGVACESRR